MTDPKLGAETLTLRRYDNSFADGGISIVDGLRQRTDQKYVEFLILAAVQPVSGEDLLQVPEGDRFSENVDIWVWRTSEKPKANDYVLRENQQYLVSSSQDWGSYARCRLVRVDVGPDRALDVR